MSSARILLAAVVCAALSITAPAHAYIITLRDALDDRAEQAACDNDSIRIWVGQDNVWHVVAASGDAAMHFKGSIKVDHGQFQQFGQNKPAAKVDVSSNMFIIHYDFQLGPNESKAFHFSVGSKDRNATITFLPAFGRGSNRPKANSASVFIGKQGLHPQADSFTINCFQQ